VHYGGVTGGLPDPWDPWEGVADPPPEVDVLEGGLRPPWWRRLWSALPRGAKVLALALVLLLAAAAGGLFLRDRAAEQAAARRIDLTVSLGLSTLSDTPPGGQVSFFVVVRNEGTSSVWVTSVDGGARGLRIRTVDGIERQVSPDGESAVPVSVRLTCSGRPSADEALRAELALRRADGGSARRRVVLEPASLVTETAVTLCAVRPDLRDYELARPTLEPPEREDRAGEPGS